MKQTIIISSLRHIGLAILNSYGMLFFSKNRIFSTLILLVSFFTPFTGACGLAALVIALAAAYSLGFGKDQVQKGLLTYSVVLFGLGFGTHFEFGPAFVLLLVIGSLLTLFLSVALNAFLNKKNLPALSLAFIISTCLIIVASKSFAGIGLTYRRIYWFNEMYALGGSTLVNAIQQVENWLMPDYINGFFRSVSAILFQVNIASGIILSIGLLIYSRIAFVLMIAGYSTALFFSYAMGGFSQSAMTYYNMGTNFMLVAVALGGFYIIPSLRSFLWLLIIVPVTSLMVAGLGGLALKAGMPVFSLPFCLTVILFLYMLQLRSSQNKLVLTPIQYYSPEQNLYRYVNGKERLFNNYYFQLFLPFMGEWMVSQGYDSGPTHKGEWSKALDFVILDAEMKTFRNPGKRLEDFYCYNKPVLSPADGIVQEITDFTEDNEPGKNNTAQNWGNSIVIKHGEGLYSKFSHLKKNSFRVAEGNYIKRGDIIAHCGNSGRSPEPHLHFQVQSTPYIGSKTITYPFANYLSKKGTGFKLKSFDVPKEGTFAANILPDAQLQQAYNFQPGYILYVKAEGYENETWEVQTSIYNESYLYCKQHNTSAYFINNGTVFYFTNYFGKRNTLLYYFYLASYKVLLSTENQLLIHDIYPLSAFGFHPLKWLQDLASPFYIFMKMTYKSEVIKNGGMLSSGKITFESRQQKVLFISSKEAMKASVEIEYGQMQAFTISLPSKTVRAVCGI